MTAPSWQPDPAHRHEHRWWDGLHWTDHVSDHGVVGVDPLGPPPPAVHPAPPPHVQGVALPPPGPPVAVTSAPTARRSPQWLWPVVGIAAVAVLVVTLVFVTRGGDDATPGSSPRTERTDPDRTDPDTTAVPTTAPPVTAPPVTVPPVTAPPVTAPPITTAPAQVLEGPVSADGAVLVATFDLTAGQVVRVRMEPSAEIDAMVIVAIDSATADSWGAWGAANLGVYAGMTPAAVRDALVSPGEDAWTEGAAGDAVRGKWVLLGFDANWLGEYEAGFLPAMATGRYTVVLGAYEGSGTARAVLQVWDGTLDPVADAEQVFALEPFDDPFFTEPAFYDATTPYQP